MAQFPSPGVASQGVARIRNTAFILIAGLGIGISASALAQRQSVELADSWKFIKQDAAPDAAFAGWESVAIPHTWNALDGQNGKAADPDQPAGYYRGPAWYARSLDIPADWKGRRIFIRFDAASLVADVWLNGQHLGQHRGGFEAFTYELTGVAEPGGENVLRVKLDNTLFPDVIPLSGDFTVFGGIYRPVHLFATDEVCITPLYYGTSGVFLTQEKVGADQAVVNVETKISNALADAAPVRVRVELLDAAQKTVQTIEADAKVAAGETASNNQTLKIEKPRLWSGRPDPYRYQVRVTLLRDGKPVDEATQPLGLRTMQITAEKGFLLNGKPYPLRGVNRHQEVMNKGWALSAEDDEADFKIIADMGATAIRLAHYPQSQRVLDICDRLGLVVWEEIPVVERIDDSKEFADNARQQMKEMVLQGYNHPSIAFWGIYNELNAGWINLPNPPDSVPLLTSLRDLAHQLDKSRMVVAASWSPDALPMPIDQIPDWQSLNTYPGWYWGKVGELKDAIHRGATAYKRPRIALSEYGAGANPAQHQEGKFAAPPSPDPNAQGAFHPEEYQTFAHESFWSQIKDNPEIWGSYIWAVFDFASDKRNEGDLPGMNDKGLVTHDRKLKKDAYFFYKANWNPEPMIYIAARRNTPRKEAKTDIDVFANTREVELKVNGKSLGSVKPDDIHISRWKDVTLQPGENKIEAISKTGGRTLTDTCEWTVGS